MDLGCVDCNGFKNSVFNCLTTDERMLLAKDFYRKEVKKGDIIFQEGKRPEGLVCLSRGSVKVFKEGIGGREQIVRMAKPVGFIGYRALFAEEEHTSTAVAIEDSTICVFERKSLYEVMRQNAELSLRIIKSFATELGFTMNRTVTLTQKHIRGRLAETLIFLQETYGTKEDGTINIKLSREDIANLSSMTTSNAIRTLSAFSQEGLIDVKGRNIKIVEYKKLDLISEKG